MLRKATVSALILVLLTGSAVFVKAGDEQNALMSVVGEEAFHSCGLDKLAEGEQGRLLGFLTGPSAHSYLEESAIRFMEKAGWERARVIGLVRVDQAFDDFHVVAQYQGRIYHLDPTIVPNLPDPGLYWVDQIGSQWKMLYPDGREGSFSAKEAD